MIITYKQLSSIKRDGQKVVLATGTFDLFHYEHLRYLEDAKKLGDILIVAVKDDKSARMKGEDRPIIGQEQRLAIVDAIKYVDYSFIANYIDSEEKNIPEYDNKKQKDWLILFDRVFKELKPDYLYHEDNHVLTSARLRLFEKYNVQGIVRNRGEMISTTRIIEKIKNM